MKSSAAMNKGWTMVVIAIILYALVIILAVDVIDTALMRP